MHPDSTEQIFTVFPFAQRMWRFDHTPTSWWPCPTYEVKKRLWMTKWRSKLVQQQCSLPFVWRLLCLRKYQDCYWEWETGLLNRRIQHYWSQLWSRLWQLQSVTFGFVWDFVSSRLILLYSDHLENHLVHTGTSSYQCVHVITSSSFTLVHFFADCISQKHFCPQKLWKFAPSENFLLYKIIWLTDTVFQVLLMDSNIPDDWL